MFNKRKTDTYTGNILIIHPNVNSVKKIQKATKKVGKFNIQSINSIDLVEKCYDRFLFDALIIDLQLIEPCLLTFLKQTQAVQPYVSIITCTREQLSVEREYKLKEAGVDELFLFDNDVSFLSVLLRNIFKRRMLAFYDNMTKALTKVMFSPILKSELKKLSLDKSYNLSMANIDYNNLKTINDREGHLVGDKTLIYTTSLIKKNIRITDMIFRMGGDEFYILFPNTKIATAKTILQRLSKIIQKDKFLKNLTKVDFSIAIGLVEGKSGDSENSITEKSDTAMYKAKRGNRTLVYRAKDDKDYREEAK